MELQSLFPAFYVAYLFVLYRLAYTRVSSDLYESGASKNPCPWKEGEKIIYPANPKFTYVTYLKAPYKNALILHKAKLLVDKKYPLRPSPQGGTFISVRHREYYLNQYLWFYENNGRFPIREILKDKAPFNGFAWAGSHYGYEANQWILPPSCDIKVANYE